MYSNGYIPGIKAVVLRDSGTHIMLTRGGFFMDKQIKIHRDIKVLIDNCIKFEKRILLFSKNGTIRDDVFWSAAPADTFWKQCVDLFNLSGQPNIVDKVYKQNINDPSILVINELQSNLFFT